MQKVRIPMIALLALQVVAVILYPLDFFRTAPQAAVLPPALLILFAAALIATNAGALSLVAGRDSLVFVQGVNAVVRVMMLFPNLKDSSGRWDLLFLMLEGLAIGISWYTMVEMAKRPLRSLLLVRRAEEA